MRKILILKADSNNMRKKILEPCHLLTDIRILKEIERRTSNMVSEGVSEQASGVLSKNALKTQQYNSPNSNKKNVHSYIL